MSGESFPVLDDARHLEALLADLPRSAPGAEVVVADGGSRDGSVETAARAPGTHLVSSARGRARQMNAGARSPIRWWPMAASTSASTIRGSPSG